MLVEMDIVPTPDKPPKLKVLAIRADTIYYYVPPSN